MEWTKEQRQAIYSGGENILLAAAAGSGKTAVLVQRIIELISRKTDPCDINQLLVLTFTDAAAREMREKISEAIDESLRQNPDDAHLQKQKLLIHSASISTIHSFCLNLIKNNIHMTDLPVSFSLISETENKMLLDEALDKILNRFYGKIDRDPSIRDLVMGYGGIKNDQTLRETVLKLFNSSKSMAYPARWLNDAVREYAKAVKTSSIDDTVWSQILKEKTRNILDDVKDIYNDIQTEIECQLDETHKYAPFFAEEAASLERTFLHMGDLEYSTVKAALDTFEFKAMARGVSKAEEAVLAAQTRIKALRSLAKERLGELKELYKIPLDEVTGRLKNIYPVIRTLKNIVLMVDRSYTKRKREKNFLDFSDLEHEALKLLDKTDGGESPVCNAIREKYREILVDEYQDTNNIQDTIFKKSSRENSNIFMVGDLKQSIYTFRNAVPKLFSEKYQAYDSPDGGGQLIRLFKNFRSRTQVVDAVNYIFSRVMDERVGDVNYTPDEYLVHGAQYYPLGDFERDFVPEFHFAKQHTEEQDGTEPFSKQELEALVSAKRIREMIDGKMLVYDKNLKAMRPCEYRDIVILMRNTKAAAPVFEQIFEECKIPVYTEVGKSYLSSPEVQTVLSYLQIVDNPRQDIPLIAVMRSPIWGFSPEELANIRTGKRKGCFFDAVSFAAENGDAKSKKFIDELDEFRSQAESCGVERLIWKIYYGYGYYAYSGAKSHGAQRQANLRLLFERAAEFEHTGFSGLFNFMNYIETVKSQGGDLTPAKTLSDGDNVVRIMTVHKSKGLEFPVVILADPGHDFNVTDLNSNIIWNTDAGIGADYVDTDLRIRYPSLSRSIVSMCAKDELWSEEMRLLYVALTRAREKLIVTATYKETKSGPALPLYSSHGAVKPCYVRSKKCFKDWIMAAILTHPDADNLREVFGFDKVLNPIPCEFNIKTFVYEKQNEVLPVVETAEAEETNTPSAETNAADEIRDRLGYVYPGKALSKMPVKLSVSEVKRMQAEDEDYTPLLPELKIQSTASFERLSGAERGTVVHFVLQHIDPQKVKAKADIENAVSELVSQKVITKTQARAVNCGKLFEFFDSSLGRRMKTAARLEREFSFYTKAGLNEVYGRFGDGEILLQGTMDCFFEDQNGRLVLIDFKTDRVKGDDDLKPLSKKYEVQMKYYKKALSEIMNRSVDECYLYFLDAGQAVKI